MRRVAPHHDNREAVDEPRCAQEQLMLDLVMLALAFVLFAAGIGYAYACERL